MSANGNGNRHAEAMAALHAAAGMVPQVVIDAIDAGDAETEYLYEQLVAWAREVAQLRADLTELSKALLAALEGTTRLRGETQGAFDAVSIWTQALAAGGGKAAEPKVIVLRDASAARGTRVIRDPETNEIIGTEPVTWIGDGPDAA